jgi:flagellar hook-associated protein 3 FlgL
MRNLLGHLGKLGAESTRLDFAFRRIEHERPEMIDRNSKEVDLDVTQAATDLRILEHTHRAALSTAGRILQPTLLDFLR